jgi:hypothetical protein
MGPLVIISKQIVGCTINARLIQAGMITSGIETATDDMLYLMGLGVLPSSKKKHRLYLIVPGWNGADLL